ncbi:serine/threonine-protein kinase [Tabrizicola sp.]|uniref:serine/threonine-protein kinase n=1 Tax=Tabrizicola sp. TaxID=2005166 RepID=UPI00286C2A7B|nr:serine/threonine-protein kinase [Tabrizicola sp.]
MAQQNVADVSTGDANGELDELQPGTKLLNGQYTITQFLNNGGFGITYLARDSLNRVVVIKECFLSSFCRRSKDVVTARSRAHTSELRSVVQLFIREAHNLARLVHPNIVAVHQVFEDNGTAYMALDYIDGRDLLDVIDDGVTKLAPDEIVRMTEKLLAAVKFIHDNGMLHRDISPDNVLISRSGEPVLIDFGAARDQVAKGGRTMTAMRVVKDGYSPQEFYIAGSEQGPYSDLYSLGATLYHVIAGSAPSNGQMRLSEMAEGRPDSYLPLAGRFEGYPKGFLEAIDTAMNIRPKERVQSPGEWLAFFRKSGVLPIYPERHGFAVPQVLAEPTISAPAFDAPAPLAPARSERIASPAVSVAPSGKKVPALVAGGLVVVAIAAGLVFAMNRGPATSEVVAAVAPEVAELAPETAVAAETQAVAAPATVVAESTAPVAADDPVVAVVEPVVAQPEDTAAAPVAEAPAVEVAKAEPAAPAVQPQVPLQQQQISFAAWDVRMPFYEVERIVNGNRTRVVSRIDPTADLAIAGDWLKPGIIITAVNGTPIKGAETVAGMVLSGLTVDLDGYARSTVRFSTAAGNEQSGLLAVQTIRLLSLASGVDLVVSFKDGQWLTTVKSVKEGSATNLLPGDVIFREKFTGVAIDGPQSFETVMPALIERQLATVELAVIRGTKVQSAFLQLAIDGPAP